MTNYPIHLQKLIENLKKFPGVGSKSAERFAFDLLSWPSFEIEQLGEVIKKIPESIKTCAECGCLKENDSCFSCQKEGEHSLCVVAYPKDVFAIEKTRVFRGPYHVLGALISPLDGIGPEALSLKSLKERIIKKNISELIIALDSTLEADTTALFLKEELTPFNLSYYRLAFGLPLGSSLDYIDGGTLARALSSKERF